MSNINVVDTFIEQNFRPVEDKPGYVWLNPRRCEMISIKLLREALDVLEHREKQITNKEEGNKNPYAEEVVIGGVTFWSQE